MAEVQVRVCDVCNSVTLPASSYTITSGERAAHLDLCAEHAEPLEELMASIAPVAAKSAPARATRKKAAPPVKKATRRGATTNRPSVKVVTLEEIEKLKRSQR